MQVAKVFVCFKAMNTILSTYTMVWDVFNATVDSGGLIQPFLCKQDKLVLGCVDEFWKVSAAVYFC